MQWRSQEFPTGGGGAKRGSEATERGEYVVPPSHGREILKIYVSKLNFFHIKYHY